jgi:hypothetical protein
MDALKDTYKVRTTTKTSLAFFYFFPNLLFSQKTTFDAHSPKGPRRVPFVGPRAWAQLPRAQSKLHGRFERTLGPPWGRTRVLPKALLCTRLKSSSSSFFLLLFHKGVRIMSFYFLHELTHKPYPHPHQASDVRLACGKIESQAIRDSIRLRNRRQDGRDTKTVRPITCEGGCTARRCLREAKRKPSRSRRLAGRLTHKGRMGFPITRTGGFTCTTFSPPRQSAKPGAWARRTAGRSGTGT